MLAREAGRLETSLQAAGDGEKLCFLHYPPLYQGYECPELLRLLQRYRVKACYYGHLHGAAQKRALEGRPLRHGLSPGGRRLAGFRP